MANDETLLHRLTSGLDIESFAELQREMRLQEREDIDATDLSLLLRLRERYLRELAPVRESLRRYLVTATAIGARVHMPFDQNISFHVLLAARMTRDEIHELVAQETRDGFAQLKR